LRIYAFFLNRIHNPKVRLAHFLKLVIWNLQSGSEETATVMAQNNFQYYCIELNKTPQNMAYLDLNKS